MEPRNSTPPDSNMYAATSWSDAMESAPRRQPGQGHNASSATGATAEQPSNLERVLAVLIIAAILIGVYIMVFGRTHPGRVYSSIKKKLGTIARAERSPGSMLPVSPSSSQGSQITGPGSTDMHGVSR